MEGGSKVEFSWIFHPMVQSVMGVRTELVLQPPSLGVIKFSHFCFSMPIFMNAVSVRCIRHLYLSLRFTGVQAKASTLLEEDRQTHSVIQYKPCFLRNPGRTSGNSQI